MVALLTLGFPMAPDRKSLTKPITTTRRIIMQKARRHTERIIVLRPLVSVWFQILFHSPRRGAFHLSLALLSSLSVIREYLAYGMVPVDSVEVSRDSTYSGAFRRVRSFRIRGFHPLWPTLPSRSSNQYCRHMKSPTTPQGKPPRFGLFRFRSPLLTESIFLSSPPGT